jgi:hypothetical protein
LSIAKGGAQRQQPVLTGIVVNNFISFHFISYADFKGAFNAADHRIMFIYTRQLGMPPTFVDTCEHLYGVSSTEYSTPYGPTPSIDINRCTLQWETLSIHLPNPTLSITLPLYYSTQPSLLLFTLFLEPFFRLLTVGSRGYRPWPTTTNVDPTKPTGPGHGFADDLSLATGSTPNMTIQLRKLSHFSAYTCMTVNIRKCCITGALWRLGNTLSPAKIALLASRLQTQFITVNSK